jgi:hypothetical protein
MIEKLVSDSELNSKALRIISLVSLFITIMLFWLPTYKIGKNILSQIPIINDFSWAYIELDFKPGIRAGIIGLILIVPLYIRGILYWGRTTIYSMLSFVLNFCLASTLATICFENVKESFLSSLWPMEDIRVFILFLAIILTWLGLREIAGIAYIALLLIIFSNIAVVNKGMGFQGFLCILLGTLGLITQNGLNPKELFTGILDTYRKPVNNVKGSISKTKELF